MNDIKKLFTEEMDEWGEQKGNWVVEGPLGGVFTRLEDAKKAAKLASSTPEYDYHSAIMNRKDGMYYFEYDKGKLTRDGWSVPLKDTLKDVKVRINGKIFIKRIYKDKDGNEVIRHDGKILKLARN